MSARFDLGTAKCKILVDAFGERNVEEALIFIAKQCDANGLRVLIVPTYEMVRALLETVHGRPDVGCAVITQRGGEGVLLREGKP